MNRKNLSLSLSRPRSLSVVSLPNTTVSSLVHRNEEPSPTLPYLDGPINIFPGIWLGSEDNARDWKQLLERGIRSILNVAKEVMSPFESSKPVRSFASTPDLKHSPIPNTPTCYPAHLPSGRPTMHYLKLPWSHGQQDLVRHGFPEAMAFTDAAFARGDGVLIHCQCGISRSATMVIAVVMRAAAQSLPSAPPDVHALQGMQGAYAYVKEKCQWISPNMSLIYQLLEYERSLQRLPSETSSIQEEEEEEWARRRRTLDDVPSDHEESPEVLREARALDKAMEDRIVARKSSGSSIASSSGIGMGPAWRSRYSSRKRTGSNTSVATSSVISEDLVEVDEEQVLLGLGRGFDLSDSTSPESTDDSLELPRPPPVWKTVVLPKPKGKRRPLSVCSLPSVPASPGPIPSPPRVRTPLRKPVPPPLHFRKTPDPQQLQLPFTPSQTLFVFPPSPTPTARTPSTMTLLAAPSSFSASTTPRVSTFRRHGRTRSFIGVPSTPTTACSRVDARGWIGLDSSAS